MMDDSQLTYRNFQSKYLSLTLTPLDNTITIKAWKNDNTRDHVLKDCLAILKQMKQSPDVTQDLPQFVELYNSLVYS